MREIVQQTRVQVLHDPNSPEIKLAGEPVWLRYQWDSIGVLVAWLVVFGGGLVLVRRRLRTFEQFENTAASTISMAR